jgi:hypothetical protein
MGLEYIRKLELNNMSPFYDISSNEQLADEELALRNLGSQKIFAIIGGRRRSGFWGTSGTKSKRHYIAVVPEDYDNLFVEKIGKWKPIYDLEKFLQFHYEHFSKAKSDSDEFLKHMRYVVLPSLKNQKTKDNEARVELFEQWLNEKLPRQGSSKNQKPSRYTANNGETRSKKTIFISYSHSDEKYKNEVVKTLKGLEYTFPDIRFDVWSDERIRTGQKWLDEIEQALDKADIAIMILSRGFIASDFIMKKEVPTLLSNADDKGTVIINLIAGRSLFNDSVLSKFQCVNDPNTPLKGMNEHQQDEVYTKLAEDVKYLLNN